VQDRLQGLLPARAVAHLRRLNQLRWITKYRNLRGSGRPLLADRMLGLWHVLFDPEVESYTYDVANEHELADQLGHIFGVPPTEVLAYFQETHEDAELNRKLQRRVRWRFATKHRLPLGNRGIWYAVVRIRKPRTVVETGMLMGLGSLALLRALERNAEEGHPGELVSVDLDPGAGWLVPRHLRHRWTKLLGMSGEVLPGALEPNTVGVFIQDTAHTYENQRAEFGIALEYADDPIVLLDSGGGQTSVLQEICQFHGAERNSLSPRPVRHIYRPTDTDIAIVPKVQHTSGAA
jgi:hypothetical protein